MRILIVGAGIAGLATYRALARRGFDLTIVEKSMSPGSGGAGLFIPGNGARALETLGLLEPFLELSHSIRAQRFFDGSGKPLNAIQTHEFWNKIGPCRSIRHSDLWSVLTEGVNPADIQHRRLADITAAGLVRFHDGACGYYDLVVGADGINSNVRQIVLPNGPTPQYVGNICWRYIAPNVSALEDWTVMLGADRSLLGVPLSPSEVHIYGDISVPESKIADFSSASPLLPLFEDIAGALLPALELSSAMDVHFARLTRIKSDLLHSNQVVLVGDAAHASSPIMAQGACMAIEDAIVLADELTSSERLDVALVRYAARRKKRYDWIDSQCLARDKMRRLPNPIRNALLRFGGTGLYRRSYRPLLAPV